MGKVRWRKERHGPSGALPGGPQEGEATARSVSAACPSSSCSGTTPGEKGARRKEVRSRPRQITCSIHTDNEHYYDKLFDT